MQLTDRSLAVEEFHLAEPGVRLGVFVSTRLTSETPVGRTGKIPVLLSTR